MIELIYISRASERFDREALVNLLTQARRFNSANHITGLLLYDGFGTFMQTLEGAPEVIEPLYQRIKQDKRHSRVNQLSKQNILERNFPDWSMGFRDLHESPPENLEGFSNFLQHPDHTEFLRDNPGFAIEMMSYFRQKHA